MRPSSLTILGIRVDAVTSGSALDIIDNFIAQGEPRQVVTVNPEFVMAARSSEQFRAVLGAADLALPDGVGLLWAARLLGGRLPERVAGSDLVPRLAARAAERGWDVFLLGAGPGVAELAAQRLTAANPGLRIVGCYGGSPAVAEEQAIVARVRAAAPHILLVAYGAPAQDLWIARTMAELQVPVCMGVGGTLDFIAGVRNRAPAWLQRLGLEWLYRLCQEPWRWRRQMALPKFAAAVCMERLGRRG
jgi:N-acetylglucosaminyldiphosphoundecaprenol N-acetyl-beta-D-mannosaminyltransferase